MPKAMYGSSVSAEQKLQEQQFRIQTIEEAKQAAIAEAYLLDPIHNRREQIIRELINMYRSSKIDHDKLMGLIGELSGLDGMVQQLRNTQQLGETAAQKEFGNG